MSDEAGREARKRKRRAAQAAALAAMTADGRAARRLQQRDAMRRLRERRYAACRAAGFNHAEARRQL